MRFEPGNARLFENEVCIQEIQHKKTNSNLQLGSLAKSIRCY